MDDPKSLKQKFRITFDPVGQFYRIEDDGITLARCFNERNAELILNALVATQPVVEAECSACEGSGETGHTHADGTQYSDRVPPCMACGGSGRLVVETECSTGAGGVTLLQMAENIQLGCDPYAEKPSFRPEHRCGVRGFADSGDKCPACMPVVETTSPPSLLAAAINALPKRVRDYIHHLETDADPAGDKWRLAHLEETVAALTAQETWGDKASAACDRYEVAQAKVAQLETVAATPRVPRAHTGMPRCEGDCVGHPFNCYGHPYDCGCTAVETPSFKSVIDGFTPDQWDEILRRADAMQKATLQREITRLNDALARAADTFADFNKGLRLLNRPLLADACGIAEKSSREALSTVETSAHEHLYRTSEPNKGACVYCGAVKTLCTGCNSNPCCCDELLAAQKTEGTNQ